MSMPVLGSMGDLAKKAVSTVSSTFSSSKDESAKKTAEAANSVNANADGVKQKINETAATTSTAASVSTENAVAQSTAQAADLNSSASGAADSSSSAMASLKAGNLLSGLQSIGQTIMSLGGFSLPFVQIPQLIPPTISTAISQMTKTYSLTSTLSKQVSALTGTLGNNSVVQEALEAVRVDQSTLAVQQNMQAAKEMIAQDIQQCSGTSSMSTTASSLRQLTPDAVTNPLRSASNKLQQIAAIFTTVKNLATSVSNLIDTANRNGGIFNAVKNELKRSGDRAVNAMKSVYSDITGKFGEAVGAIDQLTDKNKMKKDKNATATIRGSDPCGSGVKGSSGVNNVINEDAVETVKEVAEALQQAKKDADKEGVTLEEMVEKKEIDIEGSGITAYEDNGESVDITYNAQIIAHYHAMFEAGAEVGDIAMMEKAIEELEYMGEDVGALYSIYEQIAATLVSQDKDSVERYMALESHFGKSLNSGLATTAEDMKPGASWLASQSENMKRQWFLNNDMVTTTAWDRRTASAAEASIGFVSQKPETYEEWLLKRKAATRLANLYNATAI